MASIHIFMNDVSNVNKYIHTRNEISQGKIILYYCAARCIQKHFRGYITRQYLKTLHTAATNVQKLWRGKLDRRHYRKLLQDQKAENLVKEYNYKATLIQSMWRGYSSRKKKFNYYHYKEYIRNVDEINLRTLQQLLKYRMSLVQAAKDECMREAAIRRNRLLSSLHHLIRTKLTPGVFSLPDSSELSEVEKLIFEFKGPKVKKVKQEIEVELIQKIGKPFPGPFFPYEEVIRRKNLKPKQPE